MVQRNLPPATQIFVGLLNPVGARRMEYVKIHCIREGLCFVRHMRRNDQHFAGVYYQLSAINPKLQCAFKNIGNLLVGMAVFGHDTALLQEDARQHDVLPHDEMPLQKRIQVLERDRAPGNMLQLKLFGALRF